MTKVELRRVSMGPCSPGWDESTRWWGLFLYNRRWRCLSLHNPISEHVSLIVDLVVHPVLIREINRKKKDKWDKVSVSKWSEKEKKKKSIRIPVRELVSFYFPFIFWNSSSHDFFSHLRNTNRKVLNESGKK